MRSPFSRLHSNGRRSRQTVAVEFKSGAAERPLDRSTMDVPGTAATVTLSPTLNQRQDRLKALESENFDLKMRLFQAQTRRSPEKSAAEVHAVGSLPPEEADELRRELANALIKCQEQALEIQDYNKVLGRAKAAIQRLQNEASGGHRNEEKLRAAVAAREKISTEAHELEMRLQQETQRRCDLERQAEAIRQRYRADEDELRRARGEIDALRLELHGSKLKTAQLTEAMGTLEREGNQLEAGARVRMQELQAAILVQQGRAEEAEARARLLEEHLKNEGSAMERQRSDVLGQLAVLREGSAQKDESQKQLLTELSRALDKQRSLETRSAEESRRKAELVQQVDQHRNQLKASEEALREAKEELAGSNAKVLQLSETVRLLEKEGTDMERGARREVQNLQKAVLAEKERADESEARVRLLQEKADRSKEDADEYEKRTSVQLEVLRERVADKEALAKTLMHEKLKMRSELDGDAAARAQLLHVPMHHELEVQALRRELDDKRAALLAVQSDKERLEKQLKDVLLDATKDTSRRSEGANEREVQIRDMKQKLEVEAERMRDQLYRQKEHVENLEKALSASKSEQDDLRLKCGDGRASAVRVASYSTRLARAALQALSTVAEVQPRVMKSLEDRCLAVLRASLALRRRMEGEDASASASSLSALLLGSHRGQLGVDDLGSLHLKSLATPTADAARDMKEALRRCSDRLAALIAAADDEGHRRSGQDTRSLAQPTSSDPLASGSDGLDLAQRSLPTLSAEPWSLPKVALPAEEVEKWLWDWASAIAECLEAAMRHQEKVLTSSHALAEDHRVALRQQKGEMRKRSKRLQSELAKANSDLTTVRGQNEKHACELSRLRGELRSLDQIKASLEDEMQCLKRDRERVDRELETEKAKAEDCQARGRQLEAKHASVVELLKAKEKEADRLRSESATLEARDSQSQDKILAITEEKARLEAALGDALASIDATQESLAKLKQERSYLSLAIDRLQTLAEQRDSYIKTLLQQQPPSGKHRASLGAAGNLQENIDPHSIPSKPTTMISLLSSAENFDAATDASSAEKSPISYEVFANRYPQNAADSVGGRTRDKVQQMGSSIEVPEGAHHGSLGQAEDAARREALDWYLTGQQGLRKSQEAAAASASARSLIPKPTPQKALRRNVGGRSVATEAPPPRLDENHHRNDA
eukprot:scaffold149_cov315-Pinguiococcus_pyrenoidosus.AAC.6